MNKTSIILTAVVGMLLGIPTAHVDAAKDRLVKTAHDPKVFLVQKDRRIHIPSPSVFEAGGYTWSDIQTISESEMKKIRNTALIKSPVDAKVYVIVNGKKAWIPNEDAFLDAGLQWDDIVLISQPQVEFYGTATYNQADAAAVARSLDAPQTTHKTTERTTTVYSRPTVAQVNLLGTVNKLAPWQGSLTADGKVLGSKQTATRIYIHDDGHTQRMSEYKKYTWQQNTFTDPLSSIKKENNRGDVIIQEVGVGSVPTMMFADGRQKRIGVAGHYDVGVTDMNNHGQVVGAAQYSFALGLDGGTQRGFFWQDGVFTRLPTLGGENSTANAINDNGQVAVTARDANGKDHAALWQNGELTQIGDTNSQAIDINNHGTILGSQNRESVWWKNGRTMSLAKKSFGHLAFYGRAINDNEEIVGSAWLTPQPEYRCHHGDEDCQLWRSAYFSRAAIWINGDVLFLDQIIQEPDIWFTEAVDINNRGDVIARGVNSTDRFYKEYHVALPETFGPQMQLDKDSTNIYRDDVLSDPDMAMTSATIRWTDADPDSNAMISLYYLVDEHGSSFDPEAEGTLITTLSEDSHIDEYTWDISDKPEGLYYIYAIIKDENHDAVRVNSWQLHNYLESHNYIDSNHLVTTYL